VTYILYRYQTSIERKAPATTLHYIGGVWRKLVGTEEVDLCRYPRAQESVLHLVLVLACMAQVVRFFFAQATLRKVQLENIYVCTYAYMNMYTQMYMYTYIYIYIYCIQLENIEIKQLVVPLSFPVKGLRTTRNSTSSVAQRRRLERTSDP
jgi:hypothetical protein